MKTIKVFLSGVAVYFGVATLHACGGTDSLAPWSAVTGGTAGMGGASAMSASGAGGKASGGGGMTNPVPDAQAESGSRIKAQWLAGDDGSKFFSGMYDSKRKESCSFLPTTDGKRRCVPLADSMYLYDPSYVVPEYIDPNCTIRVAVSAAYACKATPSYAHVVANQSCPTYDFVAVAPMLTPPMVYKKSGNMCAAGPPTANADYYTIGAHVDPSEFVAASVTTDP